ncbi:MAG: MFS transporter [Cyclobacteriaceae bacterium]|nr:MFS transporter [Cyclobacteriaceae bacterium]MCH8516783.1 MFS transporter [Cyclobacteriaceae bacterium]
MSTITTSSATGIIKYPEVIGLISVNIAIAISWIAYHEYQPQLLHSLNLEHLSDFLLYAKIIILVVVPPIAGYISDKIMNKGGRYILVLLTGIYFTAMIFMIVATMISVAHLQWVATVIPVFLVLWLIGMNVFHAPANALIDRFADRKYLPFVMGLVIMCTQMVYALEPIVISLISFFGDVLTFVVGGLLIAGTGAYFYYRTQDEIAELQINSREEAYSPNDFEDWVKIFLGALAIGWAHGLIMNYIPQKLSTQIGGFPISDDLFAFLLLAFAALAAFLIGKWLQGKDVDKYIYGAMITLLISSVIFMLISNKEIFVIAAIAMVLAQSLLHVSILPFAFTRISASKVTFAVGVFFGGTELLNGMLEVLF